MSTLRAIQDLRDGCGAAIFLFMTQKQTILFFFSIIVLIVSEYFLLRELYNDQRLTVIMVCLMGTVTGLFPVIKLFKKFRSGAK